MAVVVSVEIARGSSDRGFSLPLRLEGGAFIQAAVFIRQNTVFCIMTVVVSVEIAGGSSDHGLS